LKEDILEYYVKESGEGRGGERRGEGGAREWVDGERTRREGR
jgi:hypothetical protein